MTSTLRYPEKTIQLAAINWLADHRGYSETFADEEGRGARVDSVGLLDGRLALIEVKVNVTPDMVDHKPDRSQSLESKIAGILGSLYRREGSPAAEAGNQVWDRRHPPLVCILAKTFTGDSLPALTAMLCRRAKDWGFNFAVWRWTEDAIEVLDSSYEQSEAPSSYADLQVPSLIGRTPREKVRKIGDLMLIAEERGVGDLFRHLVTTAPLNGFKVSTGRWTLALKRRINGYAQPQAVIGAYLDASSPDGLNLGCWRELIGVEVDDLPGIAAPKAAGFLNTNRMIRTVKEIDEFLKLFSTGGPDHTD